MRFFVQSDGPDFQNVLCQTLEQAEDCRDKLKDQYPNQEFAILPASETKPGEIDKTGAQRLGYGLNRATSSGLRLATRGTSGIKSGSKSGLSARGGQKRKKKPGQKKWGTK